jgi:predicted metalloprotease
VSCGGQSKKGDDAVGLAFYCPPDDTLNWDEQRLMPAIYRIGDLAEAVIIANQYSTRAQHLAELPTGTPDARMQVDCLTGVWVATTKTDEINKTLPPEAQLSLSPGDLDEAVSAFLELSKASASESGNSTSGTAFRHLDAFRTGFFTSFNNGFNAGLTACVNGAAASDSSSSSSANSSSRSSPSSS